MPFQHQNVNMYSGQGAPNPMVNPVINQQIDKATPSLPTPPEQPVEETDFHIDYEKIKAVKAFEKSAGQRLLYDPDNDGFEFGFELALMIKVRINLFRIIRKEIASFSFRFWEWGLEETEKIYGTPKAIADAGLPDCWDIKKHDRIILG